MLAAVVTVPAVEVELASDRLWSLGVAAIEERHGRTSGEVELWTSLGDDHAEAARALSQLPDRWTWRLMSIDVDVLDTWRLHVEPTWIADDLVIVPAWKPVPAPALADGVRSIAIDPGATFGMGDHPTTVLCVRCLQRVDQRAARVLDVGCGSGVLSVAACVLGAAEALAIDISAAAVPTTRANALRNDVAARIAVSTTPLAEIDETFDTVVANILAPTLIDLADDLVRVLAGDGSLIISGVLADRHEHVLAALQPLRVTETLVLDGWAAIILRR